MKIYFSRSKEVDDGIYQGPLQKLVTSISHTLNTRNVNYDMHPKGSDYSPDRLLSSDLVVVGVRDFDDGKSPKVAKGCYTEIMEALKAGIPVVMLGRFSSDEWFIQEIKHQDLNIKDDSNWSLGYGTVDIYVSVRSHRDDHIVIGDNPLKYLKSVYSEDKLEVFFERGALADLDSVGLLHGAVRIPREETHTIDYTSDPDDLLLLG